MLRPSFTSLLVFSALISTGFAIKCYVCSSKEHAGCEDPFKMDSADKYVKDCNTEPRMYQKDPTTGRNVTVPYSFCRKTTQRTALTGMKELDVRVIRTCGYLNDTRLAPDEDDDKHPLKCYRRVGTFEVELLYCACYGDKCNPAGKPEALGLLSIVGVVVARFFV